MPEDQAAFIEIVRRDFDGDAVTGQSADSVLFHPPGRVCDDHVIIDEAHTKAAFRQHLRYDALKLQNFFLGQ